MAQALSEVSIIDIDPEIGNADIRESVFHLAVNNGGVINNGGKCKPTQTSLPQIQSSNIKLTATSKRKQKHRAKHQQQYESLTTILPKHSLSSQLYFKKMHNFSLKTLQLMAEQSPIEAKIETKHLNTLAEGVGYHLRQLIQCSTQFMHHSGRTKLTCKDVSKAMQELDCDAILGYSNSQLDQHGLKYAFVKEANVFVKTDSLVDLQNAASDILSRFEASPNGDGLAVEEAPQSPVFVLEWPQRKRTIVCDLSHSVPDSFQPTEVKESLDQYFDHLSKKIAIIYSSALEDRTNEQKESLLRLIFYDLQSNPRIKSILPKFLKFALNALLELQRTTQIPEQISPVVFNETKLEFCSVFIRTLNAVLNSKSVNDWALRSDSIRPLAYMLLFFAFQIKPVGDTSSLLLGFNGSLQIRRQLIQLFGKLFFKFRFPFSDLQNQLIDLLYSQIHLHMQKIRKLPFADRAAIDYTIIHFHRCMGFDVSLRFLVPLLMQPDSPFEEYFKKMNNYRVDSLEDVSLKKEVISIVKGEICLIGELVLKGMAFLLIQDPNDGIAIVENSDIYQYFYEHFGGQLAARLSPLYDLAKWKSSLSGWIQMWRQRKPLKHQKTAPQSCSIMGQDFILNGCFTPPVTGERIARKRTRTDSSSRDTPVPETSPSGRNRKRKGTGLLESMLSADTTRMAKNESLSMFTESLLGASHRQTLPVKRFASVEDLEGHLKETGTSVASFKAIIAFEGKRVSKVNTRIRLQYPSEPPKSYTDFLEKSKPSQRTFLPLYRGEFFNRVPQTKTEVLEMDVLLEKLELGDDLPDLGPTSKGDTDELECPTGGQGKPSHHHRLLHYHRRRNHLTSNFSLFTLL